MSATTLAQPPLTYEVGNHKYMSGKLNAFQQFHVLRKLGPIIAKIGPQFMTTTLEGNTIADTLAMMSPALEALSEMSEVDCDFILQRCLSVTRRWQEPNNWIPVWNESAKRLQFDDLDMPAMMQITVKVLGDNLSGFSVGDVLNTGVPSSQHQDPLNTSRSSTMKIS